MDLEQQIDIENKCSTKKVVTNGSSMHLFALYNCSFINLDWCAGSEAKELVPKVFLSCCFSTFDSNRFIMFYAVRLLQTVSSNEM
uniref:Ovule protein n=1 Tax=Elaeophora elaphi TaxID=1147741 RepID=A0A0R3S646_9BILA